MYLWIDRESRRRSSSGSIGQGKGIGSMDSENRSPQEAVGGEDYSESLEEKARKALSCPCVADLRDGTCGEEFSTAFVCFIKSRRPDKGCDCVQPFQKLQECMKTNSKAFDKGTLFDEATENQSDDSSIKEMHPPSVEVDAIRLPRWYTKPENKDKIDSVV